jgi:hypothetical protein
MYHFSIYIHVYTIFVPYSPFYTLSLHPPHSHWFLYECSYSCLCWGNPVCLENLFSPFHPNPKFVFVNEICFL